MILHCDPPIMILQCGPPVMILHCGLPVVILHCGFLCTTLACGLLESRNYLTSLDCGLLYLILDFRLPFLNLDLTFIAGFEIPFTIPDCDTGCVMLVARCDVAIESERPDVTINRF